MAECQEEPIHENVSDEDKTKSSDTCGFRGVGNPANASGRSKVPITNIMVCDIHWSDLITEFCVTHEKAICPLCKTAKHRKCETKGLRDATDERKNSVKHFIDDIKLLSSDFNEIKSSRHRDRNQLLETTTRIRINVKKIKEDIIIWAEKLENDAIQEIEKIEKEMFSKIDKHIAVTDEMINQLEWVKTSLEKQDLGGNSIEAFVLMAKTEQQIQERRDLKQEIQREISPLTCNFQKSDKLSKLMSEISSFGKIETIDSSFIDFKDITRVTQKADITVDSSMVSGCVFMPNGQLVICENLNNTVKIFTFEFKLENELKYDSRVWDIAVISTDEVIVTKTESKCLDVLIVSGTIKKLKSIPVGERCWGVDLKKDNVYVCCHSETGEGGNIKVLTLDGMCENTFQINEGYPSYLAVNDAGDRIIVSTFLTSKVLCIDMAGNTIFTYSDTEIKISLGILYDSYDNFIVCGRESKNVEMVKKIGTTHKSLLSSDDDLRNPYCLAYRWTDKTLVVGQSNPKSLRAYSIETKTIEC